MAKTDAAMEALTRAQEAIQEAMDALGGAEQPEEAEEATEAPMTAPKGDLRGALGV